ncbi:nucleotide-binding domain-containing protein [Basidiobolus meristosporus CBS 931.73]|uniref:NADPH:adrenodoxin oxidoreductase, mitochondrial n=1 Tax=Basidiobolus meristosporus CBS 931.73 TaxID=1314790 RepID=A0A1Y1Z4C6_9FUNG|nr:nucleotide-binding domain-containing protein [Basidiobolus meristosporus CBS 931.73]|eukprot:ORY04847.1 nucleotide-binding domain-containing protein [Basidiobolus meristosporus CBS 931.73]
MFRTLVTQAARTPSLAIVGSGPGGFYTAAKVMQLLPGTKVDMFEALPVPHGLVRFGVAPDHPEVKLVMNRFDEVAESPDFRFFGNVTVGKDISVDELKDTYDGVVLSYGASEDRVLNIKNEHVEGVYSARSFVGWYNGHPEHREIGLDLTSTDTAMVVGQGNVALDVARVLLSPIDELRKTDITEHALEALSRSRIKRVHIVGRRGPLQVSFTTKELREMFALPNTKLEIDTELFKDQLAHGQSLLLKNRALKRLLGVLEKEIPTDAIKDAEKFWSLKFLRSPVEIISESNRVKAVKMEINTLEGPTDSQVALGTGSYEEIESGLVFRSIGYKSTPIEGIPFDARRGVVPNVCGRIMDGEQVLDGMYTSGWLKRGPSGVIVSTMQDAFETAGAIAADIKNGKPFLQPTKSSRDIPNLLKERNVRAVSYKDWKNIEKLEFDLGAARGKPREKLTSVEEMLQAVNA